MRDSERPQWPQTSWKKEELEQSPALLRWKQLNQELDSKISAAQRSKLLEEEDALLANADDNGIMAIANFEEDRGNKGLNWHLRVLFDARDAARRRLNLDPIKNAPRDRDFYKTLGQLEEATPQETFDKLKEMDRKNKDK